MVMESKICEAVFTVIVLICILYQVLTCGRVISTWNDGPEPGCIASAWYPYLSYHYQDSDGRECLCELCLAPMFMAEACQYNGDATCQSRCVLPDDGIGYMNATNKCTRPYPCTTSCPGNLEIVEECTFERDAQCGCLDKLFRSGDTECSPLPRCNKGTGLQRNAGSIHHDKWTCEECPSGMFQSLDNATEFCKSHSDISCAGIFLQGNSTHDSMCLKTSDRSKTEGTTLPPRFDKAKTTSKLPRAPTKRSVDQIAIDQTCLTDPQHDTSASTISSNDALTPFDFPGFDDTVWIVAVVGLLIIILCLTLLLIWKCRGNQAKPRDPQQDAVDEEREPALRPGVS